MFDLNCLNWSVSAFDQLGVKNLHDILLLRQQVFVLEQKCLYPDIDGHDIAALHIFASVKVGDRQKDSRSIKPCMSNVNIIACARLLAPGKVFDCPSIGRLVVAESYRKNGIGRELLQRSLNEADVRYPDTQRMLAAQLNQVSFYQGAGFYAVSEPYDDAGVQHVNMVKV